MLAAALVFALACPARGDTTTPAARTAPRAQAAPDSLSAVPPTRKGPSPRGALLRSTVLPGWGQLATGHPIKAVVMATGAAGLGVRMWRETGKANDATERANAAETSEEFDRFAAERDEHLNARDNAVTWLILLWSYNMIDAYVEGHFVGFDGLELRILSAETAMPSAFPIASIRFHW